MFLGLIFKARRLYLRHALIKTSEVKVGDNFVSVYSFSKQNLFLLSVIPYYHFLLSDPSKMSAVGVVGSWMRQITACWCLRVLYDLVKGLRGRPTLLWSAISLYVKDLLACKFLIELQLSLFSKCSSCLLCTLNFSPWTSPESGAKSRPRSTGNEIQTAVSRADMATITNLKRCVFEMPQCFMNGFTWRCDIHVFSGSCDFENIHNLDQNFEAASRTALQVSVDCNI